MLYVASPWGTSGSSEKATRGGRQPGHGWGAEADLADNTNMDIQLSPRQKSTQPFGVWYNSQRTSTPVTFCPTYSSFWTDPVEGKDWVILQFVKSNVVQLHWGDHAQVSSTSSHLRLKGGGGCRQPVWDDPCYRWHPCSHCRSNSGVCRNSHQPVPSERGMAWQLSRLVANWKKSVGHCPKRSGQVATAKRCKLGGTSVSCQNCAWGKSRPKAVWIIWCLARRTCAKTGLNKKEKLSFGTHRESTTIVVNVGTSWRQISLHPAQVLTLSISTRTSGPCPSPSPGLVRKWYFPPSSWFAL